MSKLINVYFILLQIYLLLSLQPTTLKSLSVVAVQSTNIPPKEMVVYAKQTQTLESGPMAGVDVMMASRRAGSGVDYYTLT